MFKSVHILNVLFRLDLWKDRSVRIMAKVKEDHEPGIEWIGRKRLDGMDGLSDQIGRYDHLSDVIWKNLFQ